MKIIDQFKYDWHADFFSCLLLNQNCYEVVVHRKGLGCNVHWAVIKRMGRTLFAKCTNYMAEEDYVVLALALGDGSTTTTTRFS